MAPLNPSISEAQLVSLFVESIFFGVYLTSFVGCMKVFLIRNNSRRSNKYLLTAAILMAAFGTMSVVLQLLHLLHAFIWYHGPGGAIAELRDISYSVNVLKTVCYTFQTFIADLILIYRCFVIYGRSWLAISLPFLVWVGTVVCGCIVIYITGNLRVSTTLNEKHLIPFITSTLGLSLVQNLLTVGLIAYKIWSCNRNVAKYRASPASPLHRVIKVIIETGLFYTVSLTIFLVLFLCSNNAQYILADAVIQIIGIVFNVIILQLNQDRSPSQHDPTASSRLDDRLARSNHHMEAGSHSMGRISQSPSPPGKSPARSELYALQQMEVKVELETQVKHDSV